MRQLKVRFDGRQKSFARFERAMSILTFDPLLLTLLRLYYQRYLDLMGRLKGSQKREVRAT